MDFIMSAGSAYANAKLAAARELARRPETRDDSSLQNEICRKHGVFLDSMTDDEISEFEGMINDRINFNAFLDTL